MALKKGLGKGLGAVFNDNVENIISDKEKSVVTLDINKIEPRDNQPRQYFSDAALEDLANSIKEFGIIQPLIVKDEGDYFSIIAGERRYRAARLAKIKQVPVIIKDYTDIEILEVALIENIQREDLNPLEEAYCYDRLMKDYYLTQKDIAEKISKSAGRISKIMSLLDLDERIRDLINANKLNWSHGEALLLLKSKDEQFFFADKISEEDLGVREAKDLIQKHINATPKKEQKPVIINQEIKIAENNLINFFGTKVTIKNKNNKGKIEIEYNSIDELENLINKMQQNS